MIRRALSKGREEAIIATKWGIHCDADRKIVKDGRPETPRRECDESLRRLGTDRVMDAIDPGTLVL